MLAELFINNRALLVRYDGSYYLPTYGQNIPGTTFGLDYDYDTNYRELKKQFQEEESDNFVILPMVPYGPFESASKPGMYPPHPPDFSERHFMGTDGIGRDVFARLIYGFRIAILFSLLLLACNYGIGVILGCVMGYWGGTFDLLLQRVIEVWSNVPFLYVVIIISSIVIPNFFMLAVIMVAFGWMSMTWYMRTATYKEREREYVLAARALGASDLRIILGHILPNTISVIVTFIPFSVSGGIVALTSLDYLGFGLPPPTPSWGELIQQGMDDLQHQWIIASVVSAMVVVLTMVTFIGEAIREAFDPKQYTTYQ